MEMTAKQYARRWADTLKRSPVADWDLVSDRLLRSMASQVDQAIMDDVRAELEKQLAPGIIAVAITSARPLKAPEQATLLKTLLGEQKALVTKTIDPSLIGGVIVQTVDAQWDLSVKNQLERLKRSIVES